MNMLNLTLFRTSIGITRMIRSKPTNHHVWMYPRSAVDKHTIKGTVLGTAIMVKMITDNVFNNDCMEDYKSFFIKTGYDYQLIKKHLII